MEEDDDREAGKEDDTAVDELGLGTLEYADYQTNTLTCILPQKFHVFTIWLEGFQMACKQIILIFYVLQTPAIKAARIYSTGKMLLDCMYDRIVAANIHSVHQSSNKLYISWDSCGSITFRLHVWYYIIL